MDLFQIYLQAVEPQLNIKRYYSLRLCYDLFGKINLITCNGRIGKVGQIRVKTFDDTTEATKIITKMVNKRLNSKKRIGCNYEIIERFTDETTWNQSGDLEI